MAEYFTPQELQKALMNDLSDVVSDVSEHYLGVLKKNVDKEVYQNPDHKPSVYERTGQFLDSWSLNFLPTVKENEFGIEIYSEPDLMVYNPEKAQHGSQFMVEDHREYMPEAILLGILWDFSTDEDTDWWRFPGTRDFWTPTIEDMDKTFHQKVIESFKNNKINIQII